MRIIESLSRAATLGLALTAIAAGTARAQTVTANASCDGVVESCDRVQFAFSSSTAGSFTNIIINSTNPNLPFRDDNTDPVGGSPFQWGEVDWAGNPFGTPIVWFGTIDGAPGAQTWNSDIDPSFLATDVVTDFILTLYFDPVGSPLLADADFTFAVEGTTEFGGGDAISDRGPVSVASTPPTTVPEPGTVLLLATGMLGLGAVGIRRRRQGLAR